MKFRKLSTFLKENVIKVDIDNFAEYKCGGVRLGGRGVFVREIKMGADIQKQWVMHRVEAGNVVYSTLFADKGAFAIANPCDEELVFSEKFVCFKITDEEVLPEYLHVIFQTDYLSSQCDEFKTGMAAFSLSHSSKKKVLQLAIPIPDKKTQRKIVEEYCAFESLRMQLDDEASNIAQQAEILCEKFLSERLLGISTCELSELGGYINRPIDVEPGMMYKQITVKLHGNGITLRKLEDGGNVKSKQYMVKKDDLIYSKIDVKSGAIAFVPEELDEGIVTADFPVIRLEGLSEIDRQFLMMYFSSTMFTDLMQENSKGTTNRVRTKKSAFLDTTVPWGDERYRQDSVQRYRTLCENINRMISHSETIIKDIPLLTSKYLNRLLGIDSL